MPARLRLPLALLACAAATATASLGLWQGEQADVRAEADERAAAIAEAVEERADAAVLALQGVRAAYDASGSVDAAAFATHAKVPLARPEIIAVGWAPRVAAAERGALEASERVRIGAPSDTAFTYPLLRQEPAGASPNLLDLGSEPTLAATLRAARTTATPLLSPPVRLERDGGLGSFAFVPVFARGLPLDTPVQRRDALLGVVVGAISSSRLAEAALDSAPAGLEVRVVDGPAVLAHGEGGEAVARATVGGRTWRISLAPASPSLLVPVGAAVVGAAVLLLILGFALRLRRRGDLEVELEVQLAHGRLALERAVALVAEEHEARHAVVETADALVLELDRDGVVRSCSPALARLLGHDPRELAGRDLFSLLHPEDLAAPPEGPQRFLRGDGSHVALDGRRITRRDDLGFVSSVVLVLEAPTGARTAEQRIQDAVAVEPDAVELFSIVAEEVAHELGVPAVAVVRFETAGFATIVGACEPRGATELVPGTTLPLEGDGVAARVFAGETADGAAPVTVGSRVWGAVLAPGGDAKRLAELALAAQPAVAYADATVQLGALATRDALTNLPDHRVFHEQLRAESRRAVRHERALSLVLVNLDGFAALNAKHGRLAGDRALAEIGRRLAAAVRNGELVARLAADHFGWILPETEGLNGWIAAERARRALAAAPIEGVGTVTASAGVCDLEDAGGADELLARAEVALAHAKSAGGDVTFRWSRELEDGEAGAVENDGGLERLRALAHELDAEDPGTEGHSERVARLCEKLALSSGWTPERAVRLAQAGALHDVGKLAVDEDVLRKAGPLSRDELEQIRSHPDTGAELAVNALDDEQLAWIRHHHERWDGAGYPQRLAGEAIPAGARLLALAEAWDTMTSSRLYGEALSLADAVAECKRERGTQFAPEAVDALERLWALGALNGTDVRTAAG
jgi:diguanylate cyclase (GGDEF)-like protein/PAS domain S-box-containing protein